MQANQVEVGIYVRPVKNSRTFEQGLYEVIERTKSGDVTLRDVTVPLTPWMDDEGTVDTTVMQVVQSFVRVIPEPVLLEDLLAA